MLRAVIYTFVALLGVLLLYLTLWPVPIEPVRWQAPVDRGFVDPFTPNDQLESASGIGLGDFEGPEDATIGADRRLYVTTLNGKILQIRNRGIREFADVGGRPLGITTDYDGSLLVANAYLGVQRVSRSGEVDVLLSEANGKPLVYANSIAVSADGTIYFSHSTNRFGAEQFGGTYAAALLDVMEHGATGSVFAFNPATQETRTIVKGLSFANGVAISDDDDFLLIAETSGYRILKHWLSGDNAGKTEVLLENLPAFPDNIKKGLNGRFWIGFASPRDRALDKLADKPFLRKMVQRLPSTLRPQATLYSHIIAINGDGEVLMNMHDTEAHFPTLTGAIETRDMLYLTTLFGKPLPRLAKRNL